MKLNPHEIAMLSVVEYVAINHAWANGRDTPNSDDIDFGKQCEGMDNKALTEKLKELK